MNAQRLFLSCDIPLDKEAGISRMTVTFNGKAEDQYEILADLIYSLNTLNTAFWCYASSDAFESLPTSLATNNSQGLMSHPELCAVETTTSAGIAKILREWECEELAMFWASRESAIDILASVKANVPKWWQYARDPSRTPLLNSLNVVEPIFFRALGHQALDIYGSSTRIADCFTKSMRIAN